MSFKNVKRLFLKIILVILFLIVIMMTSSFVHTTNIPKVALDSQITPILDDCLPEVVQSIEQNMGIRVLTIEPSRKTIVTFDVHQNGNIAIGYSADQLSRAARVVIYNSNNNFLYGYEFDVYGAYYVSWDSDNIVIYFERGDYAASVAKTGEITSIKKVRDTDENQDIFDTIRHKKSEVVGETEYYLKTKIFGNYISASPYTILAANRDGEEIILHDVSEWISERIVFQVCGFIVLAVIALIGSIFMYRIRKS